MVLALISNENTLKARPPSIGRTIAFIVWQQEQDRARTAGLNWAITIKHNMEGQKATGSLGGGDMAAWRRTGYRLVGDEMLRSKYMVGFPTVVLLA